MTHSIQPVPISTLGPAEIPSPLNRSRFSGDGLAGFVEPGTVVRFRTTLVPGRTTEEEEIYFEKAGARSRLFFDPAKVKAAVVTCGGLCPGLNDVIRSIFIELRMNYGVEEIYGIRYGYQGLNPAVGEPPIRLTLDMVEDIHKTGGTILGSSRGPQPPEVMLDFLRDNGFTMLFCLGGDGTQRGAHDLAALAMQRGEKISVVGIPKTVDNDLMYCDQTFGYQTAIEQAQWVLDCAHVESKGVYRGIGLVKVMGRSAGFIAAGATLASQEVNFTLIPEVPFRLEGENGFLAALQRRMDKRGHALIVVAEGAGQDLFAYHPDVRDASGNIKFCDIGMFLHQQIDDYFKKIGKPVSVKYMDPSYVIRSVPANSYDSVLCDQLARRAVHAAMAGKTDLLVCLWNGTFIHVPIGMATGRSRHIDPEGELWTLVLGVTGQPIWFQ